MRKMVITGVSVGMLIVFPVSASSKRLLSPLLRTGPRFEDCVASPKVLQALVGRIGASSDSGSVGELAPYAVALAKLGWHDGMPPLFLVLQRRV